MSLHNAVTVDTAEEEPGLSKGHSEGAVADAAAVEPALVATHPEEPATPEETENPPSYADAGGTGERARLLLSLRPCTTAPSHQFRRRQRMVSAMVACPSAQIE